MRWLMIGLLVSLGALLFAAGGVAVHVLRHRKRPRGDSPTTTEQNAESDLEIRP
jgi:hypothetical protein